MARTQKRKRYRFAPVIPEPNGRLSFSCWLAKDSYNEALFTARPKWLKGLKLLYIDSRAISTLDTALSPYLLKPRLRNGEAVPLRITVEVIGRVEDMTAGSRF